MSSSTRALAASTAVVSTGGASIAVPSEAPPSSGERLELVGEGARGVGERGDVAVDVAWRLVGPVREAIGGVAQEHRGRGGIGSVEALEDRRRVVGGEALGGGAEGVAVATVVVAPGEAAHAGEGSNDDRSVGSNVDTNAAAEHAASVAERGNVASATIVPPAMPAATADPLTLPRVEAPAPGARPRPVDRVLTAKRAVEGDGFVVRRPFPGVLSMADADPFLLLDHMGAVDYAPGEAKGTSWHPHRGFETVTYLVDGEMEHRDSTGGGGLISDGATQWMTAGDGILHVERPPELLVARGGRFHGVQLWVNLPRADKRVAPGYQAIEASEVALATTPDGGSVLRVVAGDLGSIHGPGTTYTPITYVHATIAPGARVELPWNPAHNALAYVLSGEGTIGVEAARLVEGQLGVFGAGDTLVLQADERQPAASGRSGDIDGWDVLLLGGQPIREPIFHYGPFVMNTREEIIETIDDFNAGRLGQPLD